MLLTFKPNCHRFAAVAQRHQTLVSDWRKLGFGLGFDANPPESRGRQRARQCTRPHERARSRSTGGGTRARRQPL